MNVFDMAPCCFTNQLFDSKLKIGGLWPCGLGFHKGIAGIQTTGLQTTNLPSAEQTIQNTIQIKSEYMV